MSAAAAKTTTKTGIVWNIVCTLVCIIFIPFIVCSVYLSIATRKDPDKLAPIFGVIPVVVMSGSMEPVFYKNDLIILEEVDADTLEENDIICFEDDGKFVTHRISRIETVDGEKRFYTMGDYTGTEDKDFVLADKIQGEYKSRIPKLGGIILFIQDPYGLVLTLILLLLLFITGELIIEVLEKRKLNKALLLEIERLKALLGEKEQLLSETDTLKDALSENERLLSQKEELSNAQAQELADKDSLLAERNVLLAEQELLLAKKESFIAQQEQLLQESERRIAELEKRLVDETQWVRAFQPKPEELPPLPQERDSASPFASDGQTAFGYVAAGAQAPATEEGSANAYTYEGYRGARTDEESAAQTADEQAQTAIAEGANEQETAYANKEWTDEDAQSLAHENSAEAQAEDFTHEEEIDEQALLYVVGEVTAAAREEEGEAPVAKLRRIKGRRMRVLSVHSEKPPKENENQRYAKLKNKP